ncbi:hypothetical protein EP331_07180 [bacterium]|nr:MAG: hypothetical protein EP331_07180 [bacterium]
MKLFFLSLFSLIVLQTQAQKIPDENVFETQLINPYKDYPEYPKRDFKYTKADLEIRYQQEENLLQGMVTYTVEPLWKESEVVKLLALRMQIDDVRINNEPASYNLQDDTLIVQLNGARSATQFKLEIVYQTDVSYGLHKDRFGSVWTSNQPYSTANYLPGFIHPRNQMPFNVKFDIPASMEVASVGKWISQKSDETNGRKIVNWVSSKPIAITDFKFAIGPFQVDEIQFGIKKIRLYSYKSKLDTEQKNQLLTRAYEQLRRTENTFSREYPFESLNLIHVMDSRWETKSYAASYGYIFANQPHQDIQIDRIVIAQWFGVSKQINRWSDAHFDVLWQAWFQAKQFAEQTSSADNLSLFDEPFVSDYSWNNFVKNTQAFLLPENERWYHAFHKSAASILDRSTAVFQARDYNDVFYRVTGRLFDSLYTAPVQEVEQLNLNAAIVYDELKHSVSIQLSGDSIAQDKLPFDIEIVRQTAKGRPVKSVKVSSFEKPIVITGNEEVLNVLVNVPSVSFQINYDKPSTFWLQQLRTETSASLRLDAIKALSETEPDPDFQLMLSDMMKAETEPQVIAEMVHTYASLTKGATGTDQFFLDQFRVTNPLVKKAALDAFLNYPENEAMLFNAQQVVKVEKDTSLKMSALRVVQQHMDSAGFENYLIKQINAEKVFAFIPSLFKMLTFGEKVELTDSKRTMLMGFTKDSYPFEVRKEAMFLLIEFDLFVDSNDSTIFEWYSDFDPRIRFALLNKLHRFADEKQRRILENRLLDEYDFRIRDRLVELSRYKTVQN